MDGAAQGSASGASDPADTVAQDECSQAIAKVAEAVQRAAVRHVGPCRHTRSELRRRSERVDPVMWTCMRVKRSGARSKKTHSLTPVPNRIYSFTTWTPASPVVPCSSSLAGPTLEEKDACLEALMEQQDWDDAFPNRWPGPRQARSTTTTKSRRCSPCRYGSRQHRPTSGRRHQQSKRLWCSSAQNRHHHRALSAGQYDTPRKGRHLAMVGFDRFARQASSR